MNLDFIKLGQIPASSTILNLCLDISGELWAASPAGLFRAQGENWRPVIENFPFAQVGAVLSMGKPVLAAGISGGLVMSRQGCEQWQHCLLEQVTKPVTCFAASPNFEVDQVLLAGTDGEGIIRSVNAGQSWKLVNFGLRNFNIYCLSSSNTWGQREPIFAGTDDGVYYSPNGGRAWRFSGLDGLAVLCLALHPEFNTNPILMAGTDENGLWRSPDGGQTWQPVDLPVHQKMSINAMYVNHEVWMLASSEAGILISDDDGLTWSTTEPNLPPILCLTGSSDCQYAGTYQSGIYRSNDHGNSWQQINHWVAQRFTQLLPWNYDNRSNWLAHSVQGSIWFSNETASIWKPLTNQATTQAWFGMTTCQGSILLAGEAGIYRKRHPEAPEENCLSLDQPVVAIASSQYRIFAATWSGESWFSPDCGNNWRKVPAPEFGLPILALSFTPESEVGMLVAAVLDEKLGKINFWRLFCDELGMGQNGWELWLSERSIYQSVVMHLDGREAEKSWIGIGNSIIFGREGNWKRLQLGSNMPSVSALVKFSREESCLIATGEAIFALEDSGHLNQLSSHAKAFADIQFHESTQKLVGLTYTGEVFHIQPK